MRLSAGEGVIVGVIVGGAGVFDGSTVALFTLEGRVSEIVFVTAGATLDKPEGSPGGEEQAVMINSNKSDMPTKARRCAGRMDSPQMESLLVALYDGQDTV